MPADQMGAAAGASPKRTFYAGWNRLLRDDNWLRYGVHVVNISVGGDVPQPWQENAVCRAADRLAQAGVLVAAAAGNRGVAELLASAQTPSVLTVGGMDNHNLRPPAGLSAVKDLALYHHNYGAVTDPGTDEEGAPLRASRSCWRWQARWLPSPVLPPSPVFRETHTIGRLRYVLGGDDEQNIGRLLTHWQRSRKRAGDGPPQWGAHWGAQAEEDEAAMPEV